MNTGKLIGGALLLGTICFIVPTALHGNPPIESTVDTLHYVHERPTWRIAHLVNIGGVLLWACALGVLPGVVGREPGAARASALRVLWTAGAAVFAVYFSLHAFGLSTAANQYFAPGADQPAVVERAEAMLLVLGSTAFTAQGMIGLSVAATGAFLAWRTSLPRWIGWVAVVAGLGWLLGALLIDFAVIVPCMVLAWVWTVALAVALARSSAPGSARGRAGRWPGHGSPS